MANVNAPAGLVPVGYLNGAPWTGGGRTYFIASTDTNAYAIGDPVVLSGDGDGNGVPGITLATAGASNLVLGPILSAGGIVEGGAYADPSNINTTIIPATKTKGYYVLVADDPRTLFEIQDSGDGTPLASTNIGNTANLKSGTNSGYLSGWQLTDTGPGTGSTGQVQLLGLARKANNAYGAYAKWLVRINQHQYAAAVAGV